MDLFEYSFRTSFPLAWLWCTEVEECIRNERKERGCDEKAITQNKTKLNKKNWVSKKWKVQNKIYKRRHRVTKKERRIKNIGFKDIVNETKEWNRGHSKWQTNLKGDVKSPDVASTIVKPRQHCQVSKNYQALLVLLCLLIISAIIREVDIVFPKSYPQAHFSRK